jgi:hypothetical protein
MREDFHRTSIFKLFVCILHNKLTSLYIWLFIMMIVMILAILNYHYLILFFKERLSLSLIFNIFSQKQSEYQI